MADYRNTPRELVALDRGGAVFNVRAYGAKGDGKTVSGCSMTAASATLTTTNAGAFVAADVGKLIRVPGAGVSGAELQTTISAYVSGTEVTLAAAASTTVSGKTATYGTDDAAALQAVIDSVRQETYDKGSACLVIPPPVERCYLIGAALDLTELWNVTIEAPARSGFQRQSVVDKDAEWCLLHWVGAADGLMVLFDYSFGVNMEKLSLNGRNRAAVGFSLSKTATQHSSAKYIELVQPTVRHCKIGVRIGDFGADGPDDAGVILRGGVLQSNTDAGLQVNSGNADVKVYGTSLFGNGQTPTTPGTGANVYLKSGELLLSGVMSDGSPDGADILMEGGGLVVEGHWSDVDQGLYLKATGGSAITRCTLTGVRHYDGQMTPANTPRSIEYNGGAVLTLNGCYLYSTVRVTSGSRANVVSVGNKFHRVDEVGFVKFDGDTVTSFRGLVEIDSFGFNEARVGIGGSPATNTGNAPLTVWAENLRTGLVRASGTGRVTEMLNAASYDYWMQGNCYYDGTNWISISGGNAWRLSIGMNGIDLWTATGTTAGAAITAWTQAVSL